MPNANEAKTFMVEDAQLLFRNFSGNEGRYNAEGEKEFSVILDEKTAKEMLRDGWNVKYLEAREEGEPNTPYVTVKVSFKVRPPNVVMITSTARTKLNDDSIGVLDWADILKCDLIGRGYEWEVGGKQGVKAYLQTMFVTVQEDALEAKYADILTEGAE